MLDGTLNQKAQLTSGALKRRNMRILQMRQEGRTYKEIMREMGVSDTTVWRACVSLREKKPPSYDRRRARVPVGQPSLHKAFKPHELEKLDRLRRNKGFPNISEFLIDLAKNLIKQ
jgi:hypothetical protein